MIIARMIDWIENGAVVSKIPLRQRGSNLNYTDRDDRLDIKAVI